MPASIAVGTQWGDEGKGRVVDVVAKEATMVVRYQGGHNAGHTLVVDGETFALQLIPSGILYDFVTPVIANGVVVEPLVMLAEIATLERKGVDCSRLKVSSHCHLVMPYHQALDELSEARLGDAKLGTTKRGIGPAYADKAARLGVRMEHLDDPPTFRRMIAAALLDKNPILRDIHGHPGFDPDELADHYLTEIAPKVLPYVVDTVSLVHDALERGERLLFEGAQATFLDVDHGTYPFVTSSNPVAGFATVGAGVGPGVFDQVIGIVKAYITRVGSGPFTTELFDETGDKLVEIGREYGVNTGRRRRPGWFDAVMVRQAIRLNGCTELALTKLDVLDTFESIKVCVAYEIDGVEFRYLPDRFTDLEKAKPVYVELPGWQQDLTNLREVADLPDLAVSYVEFLEDQLGVSIRLVCVGPGREQYIVRGP
ncbi:MAG: adenylosuccinate synthase [Actinobacteria bacterium]|nr:adenylosuccinate synthase [Actinomycetota bacterium]